MTTIERPGILREYASNVGQRVRVNRAASGIRNCKLLGLTSVRGREYPPSVLKAAVAKYEGIKCNVDHVDSDAGENRSYRDRLGAICHVQFREGQGLFGDLIFNPKHVLAEQLIWDAENAPQNVGFSHDARGPSKIKGGQVVVESIDKVVSVDLVANPATTGGLFESTDTRPPCPRRHRPYRSFPPVYPKRANRPSAEVGRRRPGGPRPGAVSGEVVTPGSPRRADGIACGRQREAEQYDAARVASANVPADPVVLGAALAARDFSADPPRAVILSGAAAVSETERNAKEFRSDTPYPRSRLLRKSRNPRGNRRA